ncbi:MAG: dephospho-CoA kinase [Dechloromonas sp.]|nr:dephospho-CoA kinase [Dechloromonas sp.]
MSHYIVGLTGGIGSGKTTVADCLVEAGAALVDTDAIAHELTAADGAAMPLLRQTFGDAIATPDGALDRTAMRRLVFADASARTRLESILHPLIRELSDQRCRAATAPYVILAVPLLVESGQYRERCDRIAVVDCPENLQIERVMARNGLSRTEVEAILAAQASRQQRLAIADDIIDNGGDKANLDAQLADLHRKYLASALKKPNANC